MRRVLTALVLLATLAAAPARARSRAPAPSHLVRVSSLELNGGVPTDQPRDSLRQAFETSFRCSFAESSYATECLRSGRRFAATPIRARFRLVEGDRDGSAWSVQIEVNELPQDQGPPGLRVTVVALTPGEARAGARGRPVASAFSLDDGGWIPAGDGKVTTAVRPTTWWGMAGRASGLLVVERLHQRSGDLDGGRMLALGPARRYEDETPRSADRKRHVR